MAVEDALAHILDALHQTESEIISINDAAGRVLAEDIVARYSHPGMQSRPWMDML